MQSTLAYEQAPSEGREKIAAMEANGAGRGGEGRGGAGRGQPVDCF